KRSQARRRQREVRSAQPEADRTVPEASWGSLLAAVHEEVHNLPEPLRVAFVLCDLEGVRQPDAAARLGWKPGTRTGRLTPPRQLLLERLTGRGLTPATAAGAVALGATTSAAAVPSELLGKASAFLRAAPSAVPESIQQLLLGVTPMAVNRTKLLAA